MPGPQNGALVVRHHHGADPLVGEDLQQQAVLHPPVQHPRGADAGADRAQAALHLGQHAAGQAGQYGLQLADRELADHVVGVRPVGVEALDVGEHHQHLRAERGGQRGGRGVGVDVVDVAVGAARDGRDHRDPAVGDQRLHRARLDVDDVADQADVHLLAVHHRVPLDGGHGVRVLAGHADRERPVLVEQSDQLALDLAGQHHPDHVHGLGGGDPKSVGEGGLQAQLLQLRADLRAAAVHHHRMQARVPQEDHVLGEGRLERLVDHGVAAELDHHGLAVEPLQPGQRLDEGHRLGQRGVVAGLFALGCDLHGLGPSSLGIRWRSGSGGALDQVE